MLARVPLRLLSASAPSASSGPTSPPAIPLYSSPPLTREQHALIESIVRVDQAGELGAHMIYRGQMAVLSGDPTVRPLLSHMWDQEKKHLAEFNALVREHGVRPTVFHPLCQVSGFLLGVSTALLGKRAAMACTEAIETVVGHHYNDQLRELKTSPHYDATHPVFIRLEQLIVKARDEELEHLGTAVEHGAHQAPAYRLLSSAIRAGCTAAIAVAKRW